ncbi:MAG TPA: hypothetical protein VIQ30_25405 [Pseudonocardia sp.]
MPEGTCDPATRGAAYNEFVQMSGPVTIYGRYGWDGVSVKPDCDGPVLLLRGTNASATETWYVHFKGRRGTWRAVPLAPGETREVTANNQLRQLGLADASDLEGIYITQSQAPPSTTKTQ